MKATIIYDNHTSNPAILAGWGFSCLVDQRILFDTGEAPESLFVNLKQLGAELNKIDTVVISHEHWDHTGGLWALLKRRPGLRVFACPGFSTKFRQNVRELGGTLVEAGIYTEIDETIASTGEIPSQFKGQPMPEQALILKTASGVAIITGCSHPGILTMVQAVKKIHPDKEVSLVLGGFHLMNTDPQSIRSIVSSMNEMKVRRVGPTHCTGEAAQHIFKESFGDRYFSIMAGLTIEIP